MWIDIVFLVALIVAVVKGAMRGIVMALFSFAGWFIGLAAALKLSAVVAVYIMNKRRCTLLRLFFGRICSSSYAIAYKGAAIRYGGAIPCKASKL